MKILHIYPKTDYLIRQHVMLLAEGMQQSATILTADSGKNIKQLIIEQEPDIVHCHGCWNPKLTRATRTAISYGIRVVMTPHGQLEPWIASQKRAQEGIVNMLSRQKQAIDNSYTVITLGKLERLNFKKLNWNRRVEEIHNAVTTNTITQEEMCSETFAVYQKVMDSNTLEQMDDVSIKALSTIIKAGILEDRRWCKAFDDIRYPQDIDWRRLLIYADHENIRNYVDFGISVLGLPTASIDTEKISSYFPDTYTRPQPIKQIIGDYQGDETSYLLKIIGQLYKKPVLLHLIELTRELYRDTVNDDLLLTALEEKKLTRFAGSLMQILKEQTGLDEGFMPLAPCDNRLTAKIRKLLTNHLKI
jgi:hypothetical protein